ncbi:MAG: 16S rRNA (guanine(527)-N(7))-methyltransferase RsmG [Clostridium sp.]
MKTVSVIDVGTGAGFPGIPLKIAFPQIKLTLLDSLNKRVKFLEQVCRELELENVQCIHGRAEDAGRMKEHREQYDLAVSRAVANLASLSEYCIPFVKKGGLFIHYKSGEIEEELNQGKKAAAILGGEINESGAFLYRKEMEPEV